MAPSKKEKRKKKGKVAATGIVDTTGVGQPNQAYAKDAVGKKERKKRRFGYMCSVVRRGPPQISVSRFLSPLLIIVFTQR